MNSIENALVQTVIALGALWWLLAIIAAIFFFLMPFFVFRIRNEIIHGNQNLLQLNRNLITLVQIMRKANSAALPPMQCTACKTENPWGRRTCKGCGVELFWE